MPEQDALERDLEPEGAFELPERHVLSLISPTLSDGVLSYANAAQTTPTADGSAKSGLLYSQSLSAVSSAAQAAPSTPNGATVENLDSPTSSGIATTSGG